VANIFNLVSKAVIFQKLHATSGDIIQFIPFVCAFDAFEFPLFYNHCNCEGETTIIPSTMRIHQNVPLGGALFALVQFRALCFTSSHFLSFLFPFITNDIHIISPPFNCIICIWAFPNRTPHDRLFYPTSEMCNMVPFWSIV
jgi:hypothetical protein